LIEHYLQEDAYSLPYQIGDRQEFTTSGTSIVHILVHWDIATLVNLEGCIHAKLGDENVIDCRFLSINSSPYRPIVRLTINQVLIFLVEKALERPPYFDKRKFSIHITTQLDHVHQT
jgi:hypothetical protein